MSHRPKCLQDCVLDADENPTSYARAIYQNKVTKVYVYYLINDEFEGWVSSNLNNDRESFVLEKPSE